MYTREIQPPRHSPVENGIPIQGTWTRAFEEVDLLSIQRPFENLPAWIQTKVWVNWRLKEWESFAVQDDHFILGAMFLNVKYYRAAQVFLYDKETGELMRFRKLLPFSGWHLPRSLSNAAIESRSYGFLFRIHDWLDANSVRVDIDIEATGKRPSFTAHLTYDLAKKAVTPMAVNLLFSERRCMYAYKAVAAVRGDMVFGGKHSTLDPEKITGIFCDFKGMYPYRMRSVWCNGFAVHPETKQRIGFSLAENQTKETFKNNENALWVDGKLTPLPPVRITMPNGIDADWVIQDLEGMVDLTFTPKKSVRNAANIIITCAEDDIPLGHYNGMLVDSKGDQIPIHNMWGMGEKLYLRV